NAVRSRETQRRAVHVEQLDRSGARSEQQASGPGPTADVGEGANAGRGPRLDERGEPVRIGPQEDRVRRGGRVRRVGEQERTQGGEATPAPQQRPRALDRARLFQQVEEAPRQGVCGVGVTNAYPASASAWPSLASGSTALDASTPGGAYRFGRRYTRPTH